MWFHIKECRLLYYIVSHNSSKNGTCILTCNDMFYYCIKMFLYMYTSGETLNKILNILNLHISGKKCTIEVEVINVGSTGVRHGPDKRHPVIY